MVAASTSGDFVVAWQSTGHDTTAGIYAQRFSAAGVKQGSEFQVHSYDYGHQTNPTLAVDSRGHFVVAWSRDVWDGNGLAIAAKQFDQVGATDGSEFIVNAFATGAQTFPAVGMSPTGDVVVAWQSADQDGSLDGVFARRFRGTGLAEATNSAVARAPGGGSVIAWQRPVPGLGLDGLDIYAQRLDAAGLPQGNEFRVNTFTVGEQSAPAVAIDASGDFVISWQSHAQDGSGNGIYAQRFNSAGVPQGGEFRVNTFTAGDQTAPAVALDSDGDFAIAWQSAGQDGSSSGIYAQRYNAAGIAQGSELRVNTITAGDQRSPVIAMSNSGAFVVSWEGASPFDGSLDIFARRFDAAGVALGADLQVNIYATNDQSAPALAMDAGGNSVIAWTSVGQDGDGKGVYARRFNGAGVPLGGEFRANTATTHDQSAPTVSADMIGNFVIVWQSAEQDGSGLGIYAQRYNNVGVRQDQEFRVNDFTPGDQSLPAVAMNADRDFVVVWESVRQDVGIPDVYWRRFSYPAQVVSVTIQTGAPVVQGGVLYDPVAQINVSFSGLMSTTDGAGHVQDRANWRVTLDGVDITERFGVAYTANPGANRSTATLTYLPWIGPNLTIVSGAITLTVLGSLQDAKGQNLDGDADGDPGGNFTVAFNVSAPFSVSDETRVNTFTTGDQANAAIAHDAHGNFVIVWTSSGQDGSGQGVYAQRYNSQGARVGGEFPVNTYTTGDQRAPVVAMDADGDFVVAWQSAGQDGGGNGVYAQRFNGLGIPQGSEFRVNTFTTGSQHGPTVAMDADGDSVVAWTSYGQDGNPAGIYAQRYDGAGAPQGGEYRVTMLNGVGDFDATVAMDSDGDLVVAWVSNRIAGNFGIYALRVASDGSRLGDEFRVNPMANVISLNPAVSADADGNFVIAWESANQNGDSDGSGAVAARRYDASGTPLSGEFRVNETTVGVQQYPAVSVGARGEFVVVWRSSGPAPGGVYAQRYSSTGVREGGEFRINQTTAGAQTFPVVAVDGGGSFMAAWTSANQDGSGLGVYARRYFGSNTPPQTSGLANVDILEDAGDQVIDLWSAYDDNEDADAALAFFIVANTNPALLQALMIDQTNGTLTLDFAPEAYGTTNLTVRAIDSQGFFVDSLLTITAMPVADAPSVSSATTAMNAQTASGLMILPNAADGSSVMWFRITGITNGTLFLQDGVTPIADGTFITAAQGAAGLRFLPALNSLATGSFQVQASTSAAVEGLGGAKATAMIDVLFPPLAGDSNGDGVVDIFDINLVSSHWGESGPTGDANHDGAVNIFDINLISANWTMPGDVNHDAFVDIFDVNVVSQNWQSTGPAGDANHDGVVDIFDVNLISVHWQPSLAPPAPADPSSDVVVASASSSPRVASVTVAPASGAGGEQPGPATAPLMASQRAGSHRARQREYARAVDHALVNWQGLSHWCV